MPFVTGETLRARLERERQLPIDDAMRIAREVADALDYAHAARRRSIATSSPRTSCCTSGHALVADFGIALAVQQAGGARMTQTGLSLGTPQYMSPEQAMGERTIDARSDIYALGAVTYEMLAGEPPFTGASVQAIVAKVMSEEPERRLLSARDGSARRRARRAHRAREAPGRPTSRRPPSSRRPCRRRRQGDPRRGRLRRRGDRCGSSVFLPRVSSPRAPLPHGDGSGSHPGRRR